MAIKRFLFMLATFILAMCLSVLPLSGWAHWLRPIWLVLVLCYWSLMYPDLIGIGGAWLLGLFADSLYGTILGEHALAMTIVAYLLIRGQRLYHYPLWVQGGFIVICSLIYNFILYSIQWGLGYEINNWYFLISSLISFFLWPILSIGLRQLQIRLRLG